MTRGQLHAQFSDTPFITRGSAMRPSRHPTRLALSKIASFASAPGLRETGKRSEMNRELANVDIEEGQIAQQDFSISARLCTQAFTKGASARELRREDLSTRIALALHFSCLSPDLEQRIFKNRK